MQLLSLTPVQWRKEFLDQVRTAGQNDPEYQAGLEATKDESDTPTSSDGILTQVDGILYRRGWLWVPRGLVKTMLESEHDSKVAGYFGQDKTIELIHCNFWWPKMDADIIGYIQSCPKCQQDKSRRHRNTASYPHWSYHMLPGNRSLWTSSQTFPNRWVA